MINAQMEGTRRNPLPLWKRTLDILCLIAALPALVPLMAIIAIAIRLSSRGPVLFRQERVGLYGRIFVCYKFRTMKEAAATQPHKAYLEKLINSSSPLRKLDADGDERIDRLGGVLRASGLDELPQVYNILRGEMSLVGPRPCIGYECEKFKPQHRERFNAVPGLTGLWQVSGKNNTTFQEMIDLDIQYSRELSFSKDVSIIFRTFPVLFQQTAEGIKRRNLRKRALRDGSSPAPPTLTPV
jgi:lipopolysaccharide/colanic/teichoic acid biosynthesis glycosyltransferase